MSLFAIVFACVCVSIVVVVRMLSAEMCPCVWLCLCERFCVRVCGLMSLCDCVRPPLFSRNTHCTARDKCVRTCVTRWLPPCVTWLWEWTLL